MIGFSLGAFTMMQLGTFQFGINTAAYQTLRRTASYRWPAQQRFGQRDALQYTGPGDETITLDGVVYPAFRGGTGQVEQLRRLAATGQPQMLIDGLGNLLGRWVIERVDEGQGHFAAFGIPRKQEFTVQLRKYDDGGGLGLSLASAIGGLINGL